MFFLEKRTLYNIVFSIALIFSVSSFLIPKQNLNSSVFGPATAGKTIIIDAGHGQPDGGAVAKDGTLEKDINLEISKKLGTYFVQSGANVIYTREDDNAVAGSDGKSPPWLRNPRHLSACHSLMPVRDTLPWDLLT